MDRQSLLPRRIKQASNEAIRPCVVKTIITNNTPNKTMMMMTSKITTALLLLWLSVTALAQQQYDSGYYDQGDAYGQDNLYHDYAARQQEKGAVAA